MGKQMGNPKGANDPASNIWIRSWINFSCHFCCLSGTYIKQSKMIQFNIFKTSYGEKLGRRGRMIWRRKRGDIGATREERTDMKTIQRNIISGRRSEWQTQVCTFKAGSVTTHTPEMFRIYDLWISIPSTTEWLLNRTWKL